jgi:hypothetical protein
VAGRGSDVRPRIKGSRVRVLVNHVISTSPVQLNWFIKDWVVRGLPVISSMVLNRSDTHNAQCTNYIYVLYSFIFIYVLYSFLVFNKHYYIYISNVRTQKKQQTNAKSYFGISQHFFTLGKDVICDDCQRSVANIDGTVQTKLIISATYWFTQAICSYTVHIMDNFMHRSYVENGKHRIYI